MGRFLSIIIGTIALIGVTACKKDSPEPTYPVGSDENINKWILDSLKRYYYWNESLPSNPDLTKGPLDFFASVRNSADRFSYIMLPNDPGTVAPSNRGKYGFDYTTVKHQATGLVFGVIKLVLNDSPASRNGLRRGDYITKINGKQITEENAATLQQELLSATAVELTLAELDGSTLRDTKTVDISTGFVFGQQPESHILKAGGKNIGYLHLYDFTRGIATSTFDEFAAFKAGGITDLIVDLRYNAGGQVAEATALSALIAGLSYDKPFIIYKGNKNGGTKTESAGQSATFDGTVNFQTLQQNSLSLRKVYVLATRTTASAAEVVINNLKPYIDVIVIGEKTRGKDEASFLIDDQRIPKEVQWEIHPIIYKLFNAENQGNYSDGIVPDHGIDELASLPLRPIGDENDPLTARAISLITGGAANSQNRTTSGTLQSEIKKLTDTRLLDANRSTINVKP